MLRVCSALRSERMLRYGDCSSFTVRACRNVSSKTGSWVLFSKSAKTTVSFSVSLADLPVRAKNPASTAPAKSTVHTMGLRHALRHEGAVSRDVCGLVADTEALESAI